MIILLSICEVDSLVNDGADSLVSEGIIPYLHWLINHGRYYAGCDSMVTNKWRNSMITNINLTLWSCINQPNSIVLYIQRSSMVTIEPICW